MRVKLLLLHQFSTRTAKRAHRCGATQSVDAPRHLELRTVQHLGDDRPRRSRNRWSGSTRPYKTQGHSPLSLVLRQRQGLGSGDIADQGVPDLLQHIVTRVEVRQDHDLIEARL